MLSKLRCREAGSAIRSNIDFAPLADCFKGIFGDELSGLELLAGGTLGICFKGKLCGKPRFFKTHSLPSGRFTIEREALFIRAMGAMLMDPQLLHVTLEGNDKAVIHTRLLDPCPALNPQEVLLLISRFEAKINQHPELFDIIPASDNISALLSDAELALEFLVERQLLSHAVEDFARSSTDRVKTVCANMPLQLCHGDLGPANIMVIEDLPIAVDWEDSLWGIPGYDYLYWMTFFANRKWLSKEALGRTHLDHSTAAALMVVILLLKSWLSVLNGSYLGNKISIDQRLMEVIHLA